MSLANLRAFNVSSGNNFLRGFSYDGGQSSGTTGGANPSAGGDTRHLSAMFKSMGMGQFGDNLAKLFGGSQSGQGGQGQSMAQSLLGGFGNQGAGGSSAAASASAGGASASASASAGGGGGASASASAAASSGYEYSWQNSWDSKGGGSSSSDFKSWGSQSGSSSSNAIA